MSTRQSLRLAFCGDIMLGAEVDELMGRATVADWLAEVSSAWKDADLLIGNLECPCVETAKPVDGPIPEIIFHAPASRVKELKTAGFSVLTLANNHILNCGPAGLKETIRALDECGIHHAGAGMNISEAMEPAFIRVSNRTVGIVAFCYGPPAGRFSPGAAPYEPKIMRKALSLARKGADIVVAALHDGLEYSDVPPAKTRARFRYLAEHGADLVIGHHPHVLQGLEWHGTVPIAYSLGDFLFHNSLPHVANRNFARMAMGKRAPNVIQKDPFKFARGAILRVEIGDESKSIEWHPFRQSHNLRPTLCSAIVRTQDLERLNDLSAALLEPNDPRHEQVAKICEAVWWARRERLSKIDIIKFILKPKWRYFPLGIHWAARRLRKLMSA